MVASEMLKYEYQSKTGLGVNSNGIIEPIQLNHQNDAFGLGHESTVGKARNMHFEKKVFISEHVPALGQGITSEPDECITKGIENLFIAMTIEDYGEEEMDLQMLTIRDAESGGLAELNHSQSANDEQDYEEYDESMMPENLPHEIEQLKS
ncbi:hypothetical protein HAX54_011404 [Datura stramonium]|uniref:G-patch domain-containing protein n=1 Tax=Datura stramonium TaxID=4076 RepID=A0ABS8THZ0_DATST|nr:hypothetical protein [Datura stramonium]